jgi:mono/diheme cytochrome c family protein
MKKLSVIAFLIGVVVVVVSCSDVKRKQNAVYMPDMAYSRAYETYAERDTNFTTSEAEKGLRIFYNNRPVDGTVARGEELSFPYAKDKAGDTTNYVASKTVKSPLDSLGEKDITEAERLYLINCGICHGPKLDGNGPLYKDGTGPYPVAPKNLMTLNMPEGQMFYSVTYGKNMMGSYASQLSRKQRWQVIYYIKQKQNESKTAAAPAKDASVKK